MKKKAKSKLNILISVILLISFCVFLFLLGTWERSPAALPAETTQPAQPGTMAPAESQEATVEQAPADPETVPSTTQEPETTAPVPVARRINFLLIGRDWHYENENGRSDTMMLCSVDTGEKTVTMISFLRDIYVKIPGHYNNRLNAAYSWGGYELLNNTLEENFGIRPDVTIEIDFDGFETLIDYLGGVDVELTAKEVSHLNGKYGWALTEGNNLLDGEKALAYCRVRFIDSDFVRTQRQQNVLSSLLNKFRSASMQQMFDVTDAFLDQSTSDHTDEELLGYALELYPIMSECEVISHQVPAEGTYAFETIAEMAAIRVDFEANRELLRQWLHLDEVQETE